MRIFFVSLLTAVLLVATASIAPAQDPGSSAPDSSIERSQETEAGGGNTDWVRTVGILGIAGVWSLRGINSVTRSRRERREWSSESATDAEDAGEHAEDAR